MRVLMAGCGNMGYAMLSAWVNGRLLKAGDVFVVEPNDALRDRAASLGAHAAGRAENLPADCAPDFVVLAVKPQIMRDVLPDYRRFAGTGATFLSIAAGTPVALFEEMLGARTPVLRCMPNTPAAIGQGMMVLYRNAHVTGEKLAAATRLLEGNGEVTAIDNEAQMDAVTAVSGSGPAYVFHFIECLTKAGEEAGLSPETAALLARQTVLGAAQLAAQSAETPAVLRQQVTSPNGTTAAALSVLMSGDAMCGLLSKAVDAARLRSIELGKLA